MLVYQRVSVSKIGHDKICFWGVAPKMGYQSTTKLAHKNTGISNVQQPVFCDFDKFPYVQYVSIMFGIIPNNHQYITNTSQTGGSNTNQILG